MDFPSGLNSNVYEITEVSDLFWNWCCPSLPGDDATNEHGIELWQLALLQLEAQLRTNERHVSIDFQTRGVWVFCLREATQRDFINTVPLFDLKEHEYGRLSSVFNQHRDQRLLKAENNPHDENAKSTPVDTTPDPQDDWDDGANQMICAVFTHSIRRSLALTLANNSRSWSLFDQYSCVDIETVGFGNLGDMDHSELMTFNSRWLDSGSLLIYAVVRRIPKLHNLATFLKSGDRSALLCTRLRLLPSCCTGYLKSIESFFDFKPKVDTMSEVKAHLTRILATLDMQVFYREDWAILGTGFPDEPTGESFLWPAKFCFFETPQEVFDTLNGKPDADLAILDPIDRAQAWYNNRFEREKAKKAQENRDLEELTKQSTAGSTPAVFSPLSHRTYLQDPSAVYPTPPEGFTSSTKDTPVQEQPDDPVGADTRENAANELFGEQDLDLTDADFDFFDTPGGEPSDEMHVDPQGHQEGLHHQSRTSRQTSLSKPMTQTKPDEFQGPGKPDTSIKEINEEAQISSNDLPTPKAENVQPPDYEPGLLSPALTVSDVASTTAAQGQVPLDDKYLHNGVFGFTIGKTQFGRGPQGGNSAKSRIPQIGFPDRSSSDSEDTESNSVSQDTTSIVAESKEESEQHQLGTPGDTKPEEDNLLRNHVKAIPLRCLVSTIYWCPISTLDEPSRPEDFSRDGRQFMRIAQMLIDQTVKLNEKSQKSFDRNSVPWPQRRAYHDNVALATMRVLFKIANTYTLDSLLDRISNLAGQDEPPATALTLLQPPMLRIRRAGIPYNILPSALNFWDDLGLEPAFGSKNLIAGCIAWDHREHLRLPMHHFLENMQDAYHACNLGVHHLLEPDLVPKSAADYHNLGISLARDDKTDDSDALVVYLVHETLTPAICAGLLSLVEGFQAGQLTENGDIDLVVQYVPARLIFDSSCAVPASYDDYKALAFEIYDRVGSAEDGKSSFDTAPSFAIARDLPKKIEFGLTSDASSAKLYHDNTMHIAYALHEDAEWLSASWTDNTGCLQWNAAYVIGDNDEPWSEFRKVIAEIIETTLDMLKPPTLSFRILVAKQGDFVADELAVWQVESTRIQRARNHKFYFLSVSDECDLQASLPPIDDSSPEVEETLLTPASTPNAAAVSPEASAATPGPGPTSVFEQDPDTRFKDIRDETWMLLPAMMLEADLKATDGPLPSSEGHLLKRAGLKDGDGVCSMRVRLFSEPPDDGSPPLMEETLQMYHKLSVLARLRRLTDRYTGMFPIHIATALKGLMTVHRSMRWTGVAENG